MAKDKAEMMRRLRDERDAVGLTKYSVEGIKRSTKKQLIALVKRLENSKTLDPAETKEQ